MDQVLTQQEIDMLLNAMSSGELDQEVVEVEKEEVKVRDYDFRRPTKLSKEYINTLHMIFEDFAKMGSGVWSSKLRTNVSFQLAAIEQVSYEEFIHSIPKFTLLGLMHSEPLTGNQIIEMNPQLCMMLVEILTGGLDILQMRKDKPQEDTYASKKNFTEIELAILDDVVKDLMGSFVNAWKDIVELSTKLDALDTNPQLLQNMSPNEPVVLVTLTVEILNVQTFINFCIPYVSFENIIDKLSFRNWFDTNRLGNPEDVQELQRGLNTVQLDLEVFLGQAQMTLSDFLYLAPGDVVKLDRKITEPLDAYVEGRPFYRVRPGRKDSHLAVELLDKLEGEQDE